MDCKVARSSPSEIRYQLFYHLMVMELTFLHCARPLLELPESIKRIDLQYVPDEHITLQGPKPCRLHSVIDMATGNEKKSVYACPLGEVLKLTKGFSSGNV